MLKKYKPLFISIFISLAVGFLSALLTMNSIKEQYALIDKPPLSPPGNVFGIVWAILYILMGISAYLVYKSNSPIKKQSFIIYGLQLIFNFFWTIIFFNLEMQLFAFFWLLVLIVLIVNMIKKFYQVNPIAAYLQIPYLIWCIFAAYLNLGIYLLNL